jgi:predicted nucleotidyltransferase
MSRELELLRAIGPPWLAEHTLLLCRHGSHAYGTSTPESDEDFKGTCVPAAAHLHGFLAGFEQAENHGPDVTVYALPKFFRLAAECNPGIIEVLFVEPGDRVICTDLGERLLAARQLFLSKKARHTFSGYALAQLKRIRGHHRWLKNPPAGPPSRADFGLPERTVLPADQLQAAQAAIQKQLDSWQLDLSALEPAVRQDLQTRLETFLTEQLQSDSWTRAARQVGLDENFIALLDRERQYGARLRDWQQFCEWQIHRNPARAALEARHGYDCKHASHLVRLLRMCREILTRGEVVVKRPDREELLAIKNGAWTYEQLLEWAAREDRELDALMPGSPLPHGPDRPALEKLCIELVEEGLRR